MKFEPLPIESDLKIQNLTQNLKTDFLICQGRIQRTKSPGKIKILRSIENPKDPAYKADRRLLNER